MELYFILRVETLLDLLLTKRNVKNLLILNLLITFF